MDDQTGIVVVAPDFYPTTGGYAHAVTNFVRVVAPHQPVTLLCGIPLGDAEELEVPGLRVVRLLAPGWQMATGIWELRAASWLTEQRKSGSVRAVLVETAESPLLGLRALKMSIPVLLRIHAAAETELAFHASPSIDPSHLLLSARRVYHYALMRRLIRRAPIVLSTNPYHIRFVKDVALRGNSVEIARRSFFVVPNVTESGEDMADQELPSCLAERVDGFRLLLTLGRLDRQGVEQKGTVDTLRALALARLRDPSLQDVRIVIAGEGEELPRLQEEARALGLEGQAVFAGSLPHGSIVRLTRAAHAVILLSRYEGLAMFALESLALGAPLIVTRTGGLMDLVDDGQNGFRVEPQDISAAATAIIQVFSRPREQMSQASLRIFSERFAPEHVLDTFVEVLKLVAPAD